MKKIISTLLLVAFSFIGNNIFAQCDASLWAHVYHSYRLAVHQTCDTVTGTVVSIWTEADGDYHIRLSVDAPYSYMINSVNVSTEYGYLVCEPICACTITQADAVAPCSGLVSTVYLPTPGEHVRITGTYVADNDHGGYNEFHPITQISIIFPAGITTPGNDESIIDMEIFPNPAPYAINFHLKEQPTSPVYITILDDQGRLAGQFQMWQMRELTVRTGLFPEGTYHYHIEQENKYIKGGTFEVVR